MIQNQFSFLSIKPLGKGEEESAADKSEDKGFGTNIVGSGTNLQRRDF